MNIFLYDDNNDNNCNNEIFCSKVDNCYSEYYKLLEFFNIRIIKLPINNEQFDSNIDSTDLFTKEAINQSCLITKYLSKSYYNKLNYIEIINAYRKTEILSRDQMENYIIMKFESLGLNFKDTYEIGTYFYSIKNMKLLGKIKNDLNSYTIKTKDAKIHKVNNIIAISGDYNIETIKQSIFDTFKYDSCVIS